MSPLLFWKYTSSTDTPLTTSAPNVKVETPFTVLIVCEEKAPELAKRYHMTTGDTSASGPPFAV